ncbi:MAG: hypothetical protein JXQ97_11800 [Natronospirillum sp.]
MTLREATEPAAAEAIRREYLAAMGVTQWYARTPLSAGAVALWAEDGANSVDSTETSVAVARPSATTPASEVRVDARQPSQLPDTPPAKEGDKTARIGRNNQNEIPKNADQPQPVPEGDVGRVVNRQIGIEFMQQWWARDGWLIVDTRPKKMPVSQQQAADRLMAAIAYAVTGQSSPVYSNLVDWPLFVNRSIKHDIEEAQFYLQQKWQAVQQATPITRLLLLSDQSAALMGCLPADVRTDAPWEWHGVRCLQGPSTSELLHLPGMKRDLWRALQPWMNTVERA